MGVYTIPFKNGIVYGGSAVDLSQVVTRSGRTAIEVLLVGAELTFAKLLLRFGRGKPRE